MQLLYNSASFAVVQFDVPAAGSGPADPAVQAKGGAESSAVTLTSNGIEIVDKFARREVFIQGALAERFMEGVKTLAATQPSEDQFDDYIAGFTSAAQQPVVLH